MDICPYFEWQNSKEDGRKERLMNYVVINLEDNSTHFFDTKQIAFDYIFSKIVYMTARMLTDNPADKEVEDYLNSFKMNEKQNGDCVFSVKNSCFNFKVYQVRICCQA